MAKSGTNLRNLFERVKGWKRPAFIKSTCPTCGREHRDLPSATSQGPLVWELASDQERTDDFELTTDLCVWKWEHFFIRACLEIPCTDRDEVLHFGVWTTLSHDNFKDYARSLDAPPASPLPSMFGWFSNSLPGYPETLNLKCNVRTRLGGLRPLIELQASEHPLSLQQRHGVTFAEATAYLHQYLDF